MRVDFELADTMEPLLKSFSIGFLLRSLFAGGFFVISYQIAANGTHTFLRIDSSSLYALALPVSLFFGVTIYGLHRALLYPLIEYLFNTNVGKHARNRIPLISEETVDDLVEFWGMNAGVEKQTQECARRISVWADFTHLQYTSALCIGTGAAVRVFTVPGSHQPYWPLILLAFIFLLAGLTSDWRLKQVRSRILKNCQLSGSVTNDLGSEQ